MALYSSSLVMKCFNSSSKLKLLHTVKLDHTLLLNMVLCKHPLTFITEALRSILLLIWGSYIAPFCGYYCVSFVFLGLHSSHAVLLRPCSSILSMVSMYHIKTKHRRSDCYRCISSELVLMSLSMDRHKQTQTSRTKAIRRNQVPPS